MSKGGTSQIVSSILDTTPLLSGMVTRLHVESILNNLEVVLLCDIPGDIVELGCNVGTASVFIRKLLDAYKSDKEFLVYDSFEGLPSKLPEDETDLERQFVEGQCKTNPEVFIQNFDKLGLQLPIINEGWFKEIDDSKYPNKIAFAFFDGDFYSSIIDSFDKVYPRLSVGARVIVHDYGWRALPGCKKACDDFFLDKSEGVVSIRESIGLMIKS